MCAEKKIRTKHQEIRKYPDILQHTENARELLMNLSGSYLYQDVLALEAVRRPVLLEKILQALALQVGSEVSYHELGQTVGTDNKTVEKYIDLLEKCYVIFRLGALNRNLRNEIKKGKKFTSMTTASATP